MPHSDPRNHPGLRDAVRGMSLVSGPDCLPALAGELASALEARHVVVAERAGHADVRARTLAVWSAGAQAPDFDYPLAGTPCSEVLGGRPRTVRDLPAEFPGCGLLRHLDARTYSGYPIRGERDAVLGCLAVLDAERACGGGTAWIPEMFAARAGAEIRRARAETALPHERLESLRIMAAGVAHDLNNLLTGILGNAELLREGLPEGSEGAAPSEDIERAARKAAELTERMRVFAGKGRTSQEPLELGFLVGRTADLLRESLPATTALDLRLGRGLPPVRADADQIRTALRSLVHRAASALADRGGTVIVRTDLHSADTDSYGSEVLGGLERDRLHVLLEVADDGPALDEATASHLFEPYSGTPARLRGLDLAEVLGIVRSHRGGIRVESRPGVGTRIGVALPALVPPGDPDR